MHVNRRDRKTPRRARDRAAQPLNPGDDNAAGIAGGTVVRDRTQNPLGGYLSTA